MTFEPDTVQWRGVHHLALVTIDMDATVRFYAGVLDARLVATIATDSFKHYFFDFGTGSTIAFFEYKGQPVETFSKPAGVPFPTTCPSTSWTRTRCSASVTASRATAAR
jgi:catechol 2,3-dioxygenase-like lactoylglutathione lyase family enzyme